MKTIETGLVLSGIRDAIDEEPWEDDDCNPGHERRSVFLGTVFSLTPSGKFYMPFACSSVAGCPVCDGKGSLPFARTRLAKKWRNRAARKRRTVLRRNRNALVVRSRVGPRTAELENRAHATCWRCSGMGSAEAHDDEIWNEKAMAELHSIGLSLESGEGDPCDLFAVEYREKAEEESECA